jgi:hypothetical protein
LEARSSVQKGRLLAPVLLTEPMGLWAVQQKAPMVRLLVPVLLTELMASRALEARRKAPLLGFGLLMARTVSQELEALRKVWMDQMPGTVLRMALTVLQALEARRKASLQGFGLLMARTV